MNFVERHYSSVYLVTSGAFLSANMLGKHPPTNVVVILLVVGVIVLGLPHGSLDPMLAKQKLHGFRFFSLAGFSVAYTLLALFIGILWWASPALGLGLFLLISALHFGSDWDARGRYWSRFAYGAAIISLPMLLHATEVTVIYAQLGVVTNEAVVFLLQIAAILASAIALAEAAHRRNRKRDLVEFSVIIVTGLFLHPLLFFFCYFCLLHSPLHLFSTARKVGFRTLLQIAGAALPVVLATLVLAFGFWTWLPTGDVNSRIMKVLFIGLAALVVPHMVLEILPERRSAQAAGLKLQSVG